MRARLLTLALLLVSALPARAAEPLVADLSKHLVAITTGFAGTDVLLFGAVEGEGDVVVVVRGPNRREMVRSKERKTGIWINAGRAEVDNAPSFYRVAATRPLEEIAPPEVLDHYGLGLDHLALDIQTPDDGRPAEEYRKAMIRLQQRAGLYGDRVQDIGFLSHQLFRTDVHFPANVPVGTYLVEVLLINNGAVVSTQTTPLVVSKIGLGAEVYDFAHRQAAIYGILAIVLAGLTGWAAAIAFRKN